MQDLAAVSAALADEREELTAALASVADAVGMVETFVRDNRKALVTDVEKLTRVLKTINSEKDSIDTALTVAPVAIGNLVLAYDAEVRLDRLADRRPAATSGTSTASCAPSSSSPGMPAVSKDLACTLFEQIVESGVAEQGRGAPGGRGRPRPRRDPPAADRDPRAADGPGRPTRATSDATLDRPVRGCLVTGCAGCAAPRRPWPPARCCSSGCEFDGAYDLPLPGSPVDEDNSYEVTAEFADILNVVPRSPVMVDDVVVGEVTDVERVGWHAEVTLRVRDDVVLPDNAIADIRQVSLLGEKYVALEAPESGAVGRPARRRRQHPALGRPAATRRSRRCSARCRSCSAAAASPSSAPSSRSSTT